MRSLGLICATLVAFLSGSVLAQCPWQRDIPDLQTACLCAYNLGHEISIQCDQADFPTLLNALNTFTKAKPIDLLYVNNSTIERLEADVFAQLRLHNVQLSNCQIKTIEEGAFRGQEKYLKNLNLQENLLTSVPDRALKSLTMLNLLDLSKNHIAEIPDDTFMGLEKLSTLKLSDNNITLSKGAFHGLEATLKNLNLRGTKQKRVPEAIRFMKSLAFLDLSQNGIRELPGPGGIHTFEGMDSLSALNLERNLIQTLGETAFQGVRKTLSSLSLLNNLLAEFPVGAIHLLKELRVLDIGFNLLTVLPETAFRGNPGITLLALDGNPLQNVPEKALAHLSKTLRGLSLGGRFLHCDCKLRWVAEWVRNGDLQVTSRERNPQFCGSPNRFRERGFYSIQPEEFTCSESEIDLNGPVGVVDSLIPKTRSTTGVPSTSAVTFPTTTFAAASSSTNRPVTQTTTTARQSTTTTTMSSTSKAPVTTTTTTTREQQPIIENTTNQVASNLVTTELPTHLANTIPPNSKAPQGHSHLWRQQQPHTPLAAGKPRPPLIKAPSNYQKSKLDAANEVQVKNAFRQDSSVIIQWDSDTTNILGFRVVYRLFGDKSFKQGPPLEASEREFKIKNVPSQECIVVCVVSLEDINVTPENVNYHQCREVRTVTSNTSNMDKITIAASAAICGTIIVSVIVFIAASRRRSRKLQSLHSTQKSPLPIGGLPVNCCGPAASPGGPLGSLATLSAYNTHKEWDQVSAYSNRSIPRPRIYSTEHQGMPDDLRSHISHFSGMVATKPGKARSIADGQSQHSVSNHSHRGYLNSAFPTNLVNSRPELRQSRQSLAAVSDRMSRASYAASIHGGGAPSIASSTRRARPRSRSRDYLNGTHVHNNRSIGRFSQHGSTHNLNNNNNYCDTSDNWTDHDMDIYMARNTANRNGMGPI